MKNPANHETTQQPIQAPMGTSTCFGSNSFTILVAIFVAFLGYYFARRHAKKERHAAIYEIFHEAFIPAIQILSKDPGTFKPEDFSNFTATFHTQEGTSIKIKDKLSGRDLDSFNRKWDEYKEYQNACNSYESTVMIVAIESKRKHLLALITELLDAAKS